MSEEFACEKNCSVHTHDYLLYRLLLHGQEWPMQQNRRSIFFLQNVKGSVLTHYSNEMTDLFFVCFFFTKFYASSYSSKVINQDIFRRSWAQIPASLFASNFLAVETDSGSGWIREASLNSTRVYYIRIHANNLGKGMDPSLALLVK